jgi:hypothetical protein
MAGYAIGTVGSVLLLKHAATGLRASFSSGAWQRWDILAVLAGCILYVAGAGFWLVILSRHDLSIVFPIAVAVTVLTTIAAAMVLFGEFADGVARCWLHSHHRRRYPRRARLARIV